jgi:heme exporter protein D
MTLQFDHWPFVAGAYGVFLAVALWLGLGASLRLKRASTRLRAVDPRNRE